MLRTYDYSLLHSAIVCLLDTSFGEERIKFVREKVQYGDFSRGLTGGSFPVNYMISLAREYPIEVLNMLEMSERKLKYIKQKEIELAPITLRNKKVRARNSALYRKRVANTVALENMRRGEKMTKEQEAEYLEHMKKVWKNRLIDFRTKNPGILYQDAMTIVRDSIDNELEETLKNAQANPEAFYRTKALSDAAMRSKVAKLVNKFNK